MMMFQKNTLKVSVDIEKGEIGPPTLYFLDICTINAIKLSDTQIQNNKRKQKLVTKLRNLNKPQNKFSYLFALLEKGSDSQNSISDAELKKQIVEDLDAMRKFFGSDRVAESDNIIDDFIKTLRHHSCDLDQPIRLQFLKAVNNKFELHQTVAVKLRLKKAEEILHKADELRVERGHTIVLLTLACLYGNSFAKKVMKFKVDPEKFNAENAYADIRVIVGYQVVLEKIHMHKKSSNYENAEFITDDVGLNGVLKYFKLKSLKVKKDDGVEENAVDVRVDLSQLLNLEEGSTEYEQIHNLLGLAP